MAKQRQTDVNINYKVNTSELDKANQLLAQSSRATDNLRKQTQTFGQQSAASYRFTSKAIEGMEIEVARLRQQVKLASTQNVADVKRLSDQYKSAKQQLDSYKKSLLDVGKATRDNAAANKELASSFSQVITGVKLFLTAGIAREVVDITLNMAKLTGNVQGVERAFNRAFPNASQVLSELRARTHGTIDDFELMQRTLQATNLGVGIEKLPVLFEFAATRAQQTGESVDYLVDSIVRGIGRKSLLILDNLGLSATRLKEEFNGASLASQSVAEVTEGVGRIAEEELKKMGGFLESTATLVDQNRVAWVELKKEVSKFFTEGVGENAVSYLQGLARSYADLFEALNKGVSVTDLYMQRERERIAMASVNEFINRRFVKSNEENVKILQEEIAAVTKGIGEYGRFRDLMDSMIKQDEDALKVENQRYIKNQDLIIQLGQQIKFRRDLRDANKEDALIDQEILKLMQGRLLALQKQIQLEKESAEQVGLIQAKMDEIDSLEDKLKASRSRVEISKLRAEIEKLKVELKELTDGDLVGKDGNKTLRLFPDDLGKPMKDLKDDVKGAVNDLINMNEILKQIKENIDNLTVPPSAAQPSILHNDFWDDLTEQIKANRVELKQTGIDILADQLVSMEDAEIASLERRLEANREFYDQQIALTGDNQRARMELEIKSEREAAEIKKRIAEKEWKAKRNAVLIDTAAGIAKNLAQYPYPFWIVPNLITAAQGAAQLAIVNRNKPGFAKGVIDLKGPGTKTSDSIDARLSKGESIMTADETASSRGVLKAVRARKLNDKVLSEILSGKSGGAIINKFDDKGIIQKLDEIKNSQPSIEEYAGTAYKVISKGKDYKQRVRLRVMSK